MWNHECDKMCFILRENVDLYDFFMNSKENKEAKDTKKEVITKEEVITKIKKLHNCNWLCDQSYLLCITIVSNTIKDTLDSISQV